MMGYMSEGSEITTGSLVGHVDEAGRGWVGVVVRAVDLWTYYGRQIEADAAGADGVLVVFDPGPGAWPPVRRLGRVLAERPATMLRRVADDPTPEALDGLLLAVARHFRVPPGRLPSALVGELLRPPATDLDPTDGGALATLIWQGMGYMLPPPHGPAADQMTARHLLDPLWGPPQVTDVALENPVAAVG